MPPSSGTPESPSPGTGLTPALKVAQDAKKWEALWPSLAGPASQDVNLQRISQVSENEGAEQQLAAKELGLSLWVTLLAELIAFARIPASLFGAIGDQDASHYQERLMDYLNSLSHAYEALQASHHPCQEIWPVHALVLRLAWNILRSSPGKRAEMYEPVLEWAKAFLAKQLHPCITDDEAHAVACTMGAAMAAELQKMTIDLCLILDKLSPSEDPLMLLWPLPPKTPLPPTLPNVVAFSQALIDYQRVVQLMNALESRPSTSATLQAAVETNAVKLLCTVEKLVTQASRFLNLVRAIAAASYSNKSILPSCLLDAKPLLRLLGTCHVILHGCWGVGSPGQQQPKELDRLGVLELDCVCGLVSESCNSPALKPETDALHSSSHGGGPGAVASTTDTTTTTNSTGTTSISTNNGANSTANGSNRRSSCASEGSNGSAGAGGVSAGCASSSGRQGNTGLATAALQHRGGEPSTGQGGRGRGTGADGGQGRAGFVGSNSRGGGGGGRGRRTGRGTGHAPARGSHTARNDHAAGSTAVHDAQIAEGTNSSASTNSGARNLSMHAALFSPEAIPGAIAAALQAMGLAAPQGAVAANTGSSPQHLQASTQEGTQGWCPADAPTMHAQQPQAPGAAASSSIGGGGGGLACKQGQGRGKETAASEGASGSGGCKGADTGEGPITNDDGASDSGWSQSKAAEDCIVRRGQGSSKAQAEVCAESGESRETSSARQAVQIDAIAAGNSGEEFLLQKLESALNSPLLASQIKAEDLLGRFPVLPHCLVLRSVLPQSTRAAVVEAIMPEKKQGCWDHHATITLKVDRANLLATSLHQLQRHEPHMLARRPIAVKFKGEEGTGCGVTRDWLTQLSKELVNPNYGIVIHLGSDLRTIHPSPAGKIIHGPELLKIMHTAGFVLGLAITMRVPLGLQLSSAVLDLALGRSMTLDHLEELDQELAASCRAVLSCPPKSIESMGLTFVASNPNVMGESGAKSEVALCPGGEGRAVTADNRAEYVQLLCSFCCSRGSTQDAAVELVKGMVSVSPCFHHRFHKDPVEMLSGVSAADLALLLRGSDAGGSKSQHTRGLSVSEWRQATASHGFGEKEEEYMNTFFNVVENELSAAEQQALLLFWTGLANLPLGGFSNLPSRLQLWCANEGADQGASGEQLPQAHTCFMQLNLPRYATRKDLILALKTALQHAEKFDMA